MPFNFTKGSLDGLLLIQPARFRDARGTFEECFHAKDFAAHGITDAFVQDNQSWSIERTLRGLHFQRPPYAQAKLVRAVSGRILDVAVDIRPHSASFGQHMAVELSAEAGTMFYIPEGFAHGFVVLSSEAIVHYKTSAFYTPHSEGGIRWNDPELKIDWKMDRPLLSEKDAVLPCLKDTTPLS